MAGSIQITQRRSANGASPRVRETLRSLGLGRIGRTVERPDSPVVQGMLRSVGHLVEVSNGARDAGKKEGSDA
jgi:large subunit ribosomal protein L30